MKQKPNNFVLYANKKIGYIMKRIFLPVLFIIFISLYAQNPDRPHYEENGILDTNKVLQPEHYHPKIDQVVTSLLTHHHYKKTNLNDSLSQVVFDNFINSLDRNKMYFLKSDIDEFSKHKTMVDDYLLTGRIEIAFDIFNRFKTRLNERMKYIMNRLEKEFDYTIDEEYVPDRDSADWAASVDELDDFWRKKLKNDALTKKIKDEPWDKTSSALKKRYQNFHKVILQYKSEDVFQLFLNSFATAIDPHSSYFSPITAENFDISMSRALEGIGAQLTNRDDYTTIVSIVPGGPADKSKNLFPDDRIVAVGQGEEGEMVDVIGWRTDDVVQLIRGKKGTTVRLEILRADDLPTAKTEIVTIVRDKVTLEDQSAESQLIELNENGVNYRLGVVSIPAFYVDFKAKSKGDPDYKSTTRDVRKILNEFKNEQVDGVIIDLRNNGGGSLQEAIELTGLFIDDGPVVQVKDARGGIEVGKDPEPGLAYDGPLAVLINRYSASASEIFTGAIQDYGRGIVLGEQTFGKGTVQNLIDLKRLMPMQNQKLGDVKLTIAKFYRITGSSTQKKGVVPDIEFPTGVEPHEFGEASYPSALQWDQIQTTNYNKYDNLSEFIPDLIAKHKNRIATDLDFQFLFEDLQEYKEKKQKKSFSLREDIRRDEMAKEEAKEKAREEARQKNADLKVISKSEVDAEETEVDDPYLKESGRILADLIAMRVG